MRNVTNDRKNDDYAAFIKQVAERALDFTRGNINSLKDAQNDFTPAGWRAFLRLAIAPDAGGARSGGLGGFAESCRSGSRGTILDGEGGKLIKERRPTQHCRSGVEDSEALPQSCRTGSRGTNPERRSGKAKRSDFFGGMEPAEWKLQPSFRKELNRFSWLEHGGSWRATRGPLIAERKGLVRDLLLMTRRKASPQE